MNNRGAIAPPLLMEGVETPIPKVISAIAQVTSILQSLSNKEVREVLIMVGSVRNLRIVSMDRPISQPMPYAKASIPGARRTKGNPTPRATWKDNPEWRSATAEHSTLVDQIKHQTDTTVKSQMLDELRYREVELKSLKRKLSGFQNGPL